MFDRVDAGFDRRINTFYPMGVDGDLKTQQMGFIDNGFHLFKGKLLRADLGAFR